MLRRTLDTLRLRHASALGAALLLGAAQAAAAPRITEVLNSSPPQVRQSEKVLFQVEGLAPPVRVFFSNGTSPAVESTWVQSDPVRGFLFAQVPAGAQTGNIKVTANGLDSPPHYVRVAPGIYDPGSDAVTGVVAGPLGAVPGTLLALLRPDPCDGMDFVDSTISGPAGEYTLHGLAGDYMIFAFPPPATGLPSGGASVTLGATPVVVPVLLAPGTTAVGRVVRASSPGTGVANARVDFEGDAGYETRLTDADGYFSAVLSPGSLRIRTTPSPADVLAFREQQATIGATSPQVLPDIALDGGVRIYGFVRRAADGLPLPGVRLGAWPQNSCCGSADEKTAAGDGSFALVVPAGQTYQMNASLDQDAAFADVNLQGIVVAASDVHQDVDVQDAAAITGRVFDATSGDPVVQLGVQAFQVPYSGSTLSYARTCSDGSYRLRVPPSATGYVAGAAYYEPSGHVPVAWNNTPAGTFYACEGTPIPVAAAGTVVAGIDLHVRSGAVEISGSVFSQASGCAATLPGSSWIFVDDGGTHACGLGSPDMNAPAGTYRVYGLPGTDLVPGLRVCHPGVPGGAQQCWNVTRPPAFTPVAVPPGGAAGGINFCLGDLPTRQVSGLIVAKSGGNVTFTWTPTDDPYQFQYRLRGAMSARPLSGTGSFPSDPSFDMVWNGQASSTAIPASDPHRFFLVTNAGIGGAEGPSGSYAP